MSSKKDKSKASHAKEPSTPDKRHSKHSSSSARKSSVYPAHWSAQRMQQAILEHDPNVHVGNLRVSPNNPSEAYITVPAFDYDINISGFTNRNRAFDGDSVMVQLLDPSEWAEVDPQRAFLSPDKQRQRQLEASMQSMSLASASTPAKTNSTHQPVGRVVGIVQSNPVLALPIVASLRSNTQQFRAPPGFALVVPVNNALPFAYIPLSECPENFEKNPVAHQNTLFSVRLLPWEEDQKQPLCSLDRNLGDCGSIPAETEAILSMNQVDTTPFAPEVLACLDEFQNWGITEQELAKRKDLRRECIFTCDPLTAKDLDDALSITKLPDGRFKVGVHIADVSHFVRPDTALDEQASQRCTTVYMVQKAIPMLPNLLCEQLCSLNQGVDRLAFSVEFLMNDDGTLVENEQPWFGKTVIRSCAKLDYGTVQEIIDGKIDYQNCDDAFASRPVYQQPEQPHSPSVIVEKSLQLHHLARQRRANRYANGALSLQRSKISFILDGEGKPIQWFTYVQKTANQMVEEFMLLGNELVARQIEKYTQSALLRCHPVPVEHKLQEYAKSISSVFGVDFQVASAGQVYQSLKTLTAGQTSAAVEMLLTHAMRPAEYFSIGVTADQSLWRHYALNMERYTHFTSPIRRYADVIVHRLLSASLCNGPVLPWEEVDKIAKRCNEKRSLSRKAQESSSKLFLCLLLQHRPQTMQAFITGVGPSTFSIGIPSIGLERRMHAQKDCPDVESFSFVRADDTHSSECLQLKWRSGHVQSLKLLEPISVRVSASVGRGLSDVRCELVDPTSIDQSSATPVVPDRNDVVHVCDDKELHRVVGASNNDLFDD